MYPSIYFVNNPQEQVLCLLPYPPMLQPLMSFDAVRLLLTLILLNFLLGTSSFFKLFATCFVAFDKQSSNSIRFKKTHYTWTLTCFLIIYLLLFAILRPLTGPNILLNILHSNTFIELLSLLISLIGCPEFLTTGRISVVIYHSYTVP